MVVIPGLGDFTSLTKLLSLGSNDIFQCASIQATIISHWDGWAKKLFLMQSFLYLFWLTSLSWLNEIYLNHQLHTSYRLFDDNGWGKTISPSGKHEAWSYSTPILCINFALVFTSCVLFPHITVLTIRLLRKIRGSGTGFTSGVAALNTMFTK